MMNTYQMIIMVAVISLGTIITRFLPFILFPEGKKHPAIIDYLCRVLPPAMMGLLIIYCLKDASFTSGNFAMPEIISIVVVALVHLWRRNVLLSIAIGTILYMILVQLVFA